jgi:hypothetical protein
VRDGALLAALMGLLSLATAQLRLRASSTRVRSRSSLRPRPNRVANNEGAGREAHAADRGAVVATAWVGMVLATVALFGHLTAPIADPLWIALLGVAFATIPAAVVIGRWR